MTGPVIFITCFCQSLDSVDIVCINIQNFSQTGLCSDHYHDCANTESCFTSFCLCENWYLHSHCYFFPPLLQSPRSYVSCWFRDTFRKHHLAGMLAPLELRRLAHLWMCDRLVKVTFRREIIRCTVVNVQEAKYYKVWKVTEVYYQEGNFLLSTILQ